ncbi:aspartate--tRNA ligase, mitochondrial isoform X1 [Copidosoma floridanum]|uniref:aspartate--tRNA ligase, mitochondrial isoform X1 n=1 Tax=Copidosoma floridanum TaxID=29053 RepID=UPI0006C9CA11|nr:aspartate--tRNA ligase, mitochondrial isoform X1 [Copidosoma floridanum]XP_014205432.1 aspartate--tRNA ligase, mitochondrial isoform X1 [Copidosoma floridanum]
MFTSNFLIASCCTRYRNLIRLLESSNRIYHHLQYPAIRGCSQQTSSQAISSFQASNESQFYKAVNKFVCRSHTCGELGVLNVGQKVKVCGWLEFQRMGKFFVLRDAYGSLQCLIPEQREDLSNILKNLSYESVLGVIGVVVSRPKDKCNLKMKTGSIEVLTEAVDILNLATQQLPFSIRNYSKAKESLQLQYRYLALRFQKLQKNLRIRSWMIMKMRDYLSNRCGFIDVVTPTLFRKTPGGAQEFVVPTKHPGKFYSLVQSPQQFKQLLMVGGIDRYFQVAQCFRDEGSRSDRQPEFTQLDIEMSFVSRKDVMEMIEELILYSWPEFLELPITPFQHLTYEEAMEAYGTDCPDLRIPGKIHKVSPTRRYSDDNFDESFDIYATTLIAKQPFLTKSIKETLSAFSKKTYPKASLIQLTVSDTRLCELRTLFSECTRIGIVKSLNLKQDDILLLSYGPKSDARQLLGKIRVELINILESKGMHIRSSSYEFVWIYDFPLFTESDCKVLETTHHPFTQPHPEDINKLCTDPQKVRGLQYDLVLNGSEIGGGSVRIHQKELQETILKLLKIDSSKLSYFLEALGSGAPPHGGIALGLDRYISILCNASNIKEVMAFPKTMEGRDLMSGAPSCISENDEEQYHIKVCKTNKC